MSRAGLAGVLLAAAAALLAGCASRPESVATACGLLPADCAGPAPAALLAASGGSDPGYERHFRAVVARDRLASLDRANGTGPFGRDFRSLGNRALIAEYRALMATTGAGATPGGGAGHGRYDGRWRASRQTLYVAADGPADGTFDFSGLEALSVEVVLRQIGPVPLTVRGRCDGDAAIATWNGRRRVAARSDFRLVLARAGAADDHASLFPGTSVDRCSLTLTAAGAAPRRLTLRREEHAEPALAAFDAGYERCPTPDLARLPPLDRAFYAPGWLSQTCPLPLGRPVLLGDSRDAFNAKVEALAGTRLPDAFFERGDPEAPIDLSGAPDLALIYLSYLDYKADFSGRVIERLIRHHAARGTKVRIMVTGLLERDKDRALLRRLAADFPRVQLQEFAWEAADGAPPGENLSELYKTHHVKMLATVATEPGGSRVIIGGRNIHDGFLFHEPVDLSAHPGLHQYGRRNGLSLNYYSNWADFDLEIAEPAAVEALTLHLATLWHRDADTNLSRPVAVPGRTVARPPPGIMRHFLSVPYADGRALEHYYAALIDGAERTIEIVNPYLNLTPPLAAAFERALARGVDVTIVGRIDMDGELGGKFLTELNEMFVQRYAGRMAVYDFRAPEVVLHSKILMIDGRLVTVSSVNLNHRSFLHDSENGVAVLDEAFYARMKPVFEAYRHKARRVGPDVEIPLLFRLFFASQLVREMF